MSVHHQTSLSYSRTSCLVIQWGLWFVCRPLCLVILSFVHKKIQVKWNPGSAPPSHADTQWVFHLSVSFAWMFCWWKYSSVVLVMCDALCPGGGGCAWREKVRLCQPCSHHRGVFPGEPHQGEETFKRICMLLFSSVQLIYTSFSLPLL